MNCIGKAIAGHAARGGDKNNPELAKKIGKYENSLTDLVNLIIADCSAKMIENHEPNLMPNKNIEQ